MISVSRDASMVKGRKGEREKRRDERGDRREEKGERREERGKRREEKGEREGLTLRGGDDIVVMEVGGPVITVTCYPSQALTLTPVLSGKSIYDIP